MKMNKKVLGLIAVFVVILLVLLIVLANRKPGSSTTTTPTPTGTTGNITLTWWNLFEPEANVSPLIEAFNKVHPEIEIQYVQVGKDGIDNYRTDIESNLKDNDVVTSPDIFPIHNTWTKKFETLSIVAPSTIVTADDIDEFYSTVRSDFVDNGKLYALPLYLDSIAVIYNKKLLSEQGYSAPAQSWGDFELQAKNLTKSSSDGKLAQAGFSAYLSSNSEFYFEVMSNMFLQNGVEMVKNGKSTIQDQPEANSTIASYYKFANGEYKSWDASMPKDIAAFLDGRLAMYPAPSWRLNDVLKYNQQYNLGLEIGVSPLPQYYNSVESYPASYWGLAVSKDSQHANAAWTFIKFITEETQLKQLNQTVLTNGRMKGIIYPRKSMASENLQDPLLAPYATSLGKYNTWSMYDGWAMKKQWDELFKKSVDAAAIQNAINSVQPVSSK